MGNFTKLSMDDLSGIKRNMEENIYTTYSKGYKRGYNEGYKDAKAEIPNQNKQIQNIQALCMLLGVNVLSYDRDLAGYIRLKLPGKITREWFDKPFNGNIEVFEDEINE